MSSSELQTDLAKLNEAMAARNAELAKVKGNVQTARMTLTELHKGLAQARRTVLQPIDDDRTAVYQPQQETTAEVPRL